MFRSPERSHDDHLHNLLDQRAAHADVHARFSTISEYSDTPSVYSRPNFSPMVPDNRTYRGGYDYPSSLSPSYHQSNGDHPPSMLDLDDDPRASYAPSEGYDDDDDDDATFEGRGDAEPVTRMSYLGPKMRFHSRAPWEMENDPLDEEDEVESPRHFTSGFPFSRANGSKPPTSGSSSPRPSYGSRPSAESSRSQVPPKRSFETINSQVSYPRGALYALAQESLSTSSLSRSVAPPKETLRSKFSLGRLRPDAPTVPLPPSPSYGRFPTSPQHAQSFEIPARSYANPHYSTNNQSNSLTETMHPYANPDLVVSYAEDQPMSNYPTPPRNDSNITVTESFSTDSAMKSGVRPTLTPDTSTNSITSKHRASSIQAKDISSPVPVLGPTQRTDAPASDSRQDYILNGVSNLPGWTERNVIPTFSLISLEEARAQRMRSSTANVPSRLSTSSGASNSSTPFPAGENENAHVLQSTDSSPFGNLTSRARGRSISAGAKAKSAIHTFVGQPKTERRDSEPAAVLAQQLGNGSGGKSLKHKKSGFMRLFNASKVQEKDELERESPPPVPSLPGTLFNLPVPRTPKSSGHRIPVPSLSPSLFEVASVESSNTLLSESNSAKVNLSPQRRTPPSLSINTIQQGITSRSSTSAVAERPVQMLMNTLERPWQADQPQSAPPNISEFPALKLRPVSTLFSAHFTDHIVTPISRSSTETTDLDTPRSSSPNGLMSPLTPGSSIRTSNDQLLPMSSVSSEEQYVVKSLQEQLVSAKKAWQRHIWELEGQVRDLKTELEEMKAKQGDEFCDACGRGKKKDAPSSAGGVVNRPRARTGTSSRFGNAMP
ncbi:hypothetical protein GALMADRAFT_218427 [Galerina marginata CBS 339.88]|uniref:Uncharacterized protein n=1 Tax=Galerina marginata (strain CBS 339.88) TaxID=685588 RepID=A0A067TZ84_GALM3|nr:hypothetical protein GALMADRAFT_218427 [Galerina marginata CBS 339.88]